MSKFSERLKELRLEKKWAISVLSKKIEVGHGTVSRWENNQADIKSEQLIKLARVFGVSVGYLVGEED